MQCLQIIESKEARAFCDEIAPSEHVTQFYADDGVLLDTLTRFAGSGLIAGDSIIVIATRGHLRALRERLMLARMDLASAIIEDRYITLDAEAALSSFMVENCPDEKLFGDLISHLFRRATGNGRRVRAFGEMVALLWARGHARATVRIELMWNQFCRKSGLSLFCAYPKAGFTEHSSQTLAEICAAHSRVL